MCAALFPPFFAFNTWCVTCTSSPSIQVGLDVQFASKWASAIQSNMVALHGPGTLWQAIQAESASQECDDPWMVVPAKIGPRRGPLPAPAHVAARTPGAPVCAGQANKQKQVRPTPPPPPPPATYGGLSLPVHDLCCTPQATYGGLSLPVHDLCCTPQPRTGASTSLYMTSAAPPQPRTGASTSLYMTSAAPPSHVRGPPPPCT